MEVRGKPTHLFCRLQQMLCDDARLQRAEADAAGRVFDGEEKFGKAAAVSLVMGVFGCFAAFFYTWFSRKEALE